MNEETMNAAPAAQAEPDQNAQDAAASENESGDQGPLASMHITPAEDGGAVIEHEPKLPARVKSMGMESHKVRKHVVKSHKELVAHMERHGKRLKP